MKKLLSVLLLLTLSLSLALSLTACGDKPGNGDDGPGDGEGEVAYTVIFKDRNGAPVSGVSLMISDSKSVFESKTSDKDGKASYKPADGKENSNLGVMVMSVPAGYEKPVLTSGAFHGVFAQNKEITIIINETAAAAMTAYTVKIVDQNNNPVAGVELQICHAVCVQCELTDADGRTVKELPASVGESTLKVGILSVPEGYTIPAATIDGAYHDTIEPGETEVTITITKN